MKWEDLPTAIESLLEQAEMHVAENFREAGDEPTEEEWAAFRFGFRTGAGAIIAGFRGGGADPESPGSQW